MTTDSRTGVTSIVLEGEIVLMYYFHPPCVVGSDYHLYCIDTLEPGWLEFLGTYYFFNEEDCTTFITRWA